MMVTVYITVQIVQLRYCIRLSILETINFTRSLLHQLI